MRNWNLNCAEIATALVLSGTFAIVALGGLSAQEQKPAGTRPDGVEGKTMTEVSGFYCNLKALTSPEREHHSRLSQKLNEARIETKELADGYDFRFAPESVSVAELADWVSNERKCCPFFDFAIELKRDGGAVWLKLTGSEGVKPFIRSEFKIKPAGGESAHE